MKITKEKYFHFLIYMLLMTTFLPIVYHNLPFPFRSFKFFWGPLWLLSLLIFEPKIFSNRLVVYLFIYGLFTVLILPKIVWINIGDWYYSTNIVNEFYIYLVGVTLFIYLSLKKNKLFWAKITYVILIFFFVTALLTLYSSQVDPLYARYLAGGSGYDKFSEQGSFFWRLGGALYSQGQAMVLLLPMLIYYYKSKSIYFVSSRWILLFLLLLFMAIVKMQFFANIIVASAVIIMALLGSKRRKVTYITLAVVFFFFVLFPRDTFADFLIYLSGFFEPGSQNHFKLVDAANFLKLGAVVDDGTAVGSRSARYPELAVAFLRSPIFGNASALTPLDINNAFHLYLGGKLANLGLLAFYFYILLHFKFLKRAVFLFKNNAFKYYYWLGVGALLSLTLMKQVAGREIWLTYFVLLPGFYFLPLLNKKYE